MNSKRNKNKKPTKSPNPNPQVPQNVTVPENVDDIQIVHKTDSEIKIDERVPEITSDVTVSDVGKEVEVESPKKPKRNRGKKKKQDKDSEIEENQEDKAVQLAPEEDKKGSTDVTTGNEEPETQTLEIQNVTPTARKKKNKTKAEGNFDTIPVKQEIVKETPVIVDISEIDKINTPLDVSPEAPFKPAEEVKPAKKKNKKKKHHDSEKSDKEEEISSTDTLKKTLLEAEEKSKVVEAKHGTLENIVSVEHLTGKIDITALEDKKEDHTLQLDEEHTKGEDVILKAGSGKNKKKNKKGKISKVDDEQQVQSRSESQCDVVCEDKSPIPIDIKPAGDLTGKNDNSEIFTENIITEPTILIEEDATKPKAKIAKPVDKKRKEISQSDAKRNQSETSSVSEISKDSEKENVVDLVTQSSGEKETALQEETKIKEIPITEESKDEVILTSLVELINIPQSSMGKKRRKSPKLSVETQEIEKESELCSTSPEQNIKRKEASSLDSGSLAPIGEPLLSDQQIEMNIPDPVIVLKCEPEPIQEMHSSPSGHDAFGVSINKPGKKQKKSPKPTKTLDIVASGEPAEQNIAGARQVPKEQGDVKDKKIDIFFDMPHMEYVELKSDKADEYQDHQSKRDLKSDDSVQNPQANSQQQLDDNNNTVIQDISQIDDTKLAIPIMIPDTPFIQGDMSLASIEIVPSEVGVIGTEVTETLPKEPEKTDIKSKMMEVNQDMEELRLSIEKSLAELTSMEKKEEKVEKNYAEQIQNQPQNMKSVETDAAQTIVLDSTAVQLQTQVADLPQGNIEITTITEHNPVISETAPVYPAPLILPMPTDIIKEVECVKKDKEQKVISLEGIPPPPPMPIEISTKEEEIKSSTKENKPTESTDEPPVCPARKDQKSKSKSKRKGKQETGQTSSQTECTSASTNVSKESKKEQKAEKSHEKSKQHCNLEEIINDSNEPQRREQTLSNFEPIESFEDAMTSSIDDVNKSFELIANEAQTMGSHVNPEINITAPIEETNIEKKDEKINPVSQPKNLLGHPVIPARSNKMDYKKEKNKTPNAILAKVKIKDSIQIEKKQSKESQTENIQKFMKKKSIDESFSTLINGNEEFVYKYSFRRVFLPSICHVCKKVLKTTRVVCSYCNLLFYCSSKHKDEDWPQHQGLCFAVSTIVHLKDQKYIYEDAKDITGHNYRLLRMQMIVSCEKILKRKLVPWEQETLLYPRMCADIGCREWRQNKVIDCEDCGQVAYCSGYPDHLPISHKRWCKSYSLYQKLVCHQQTKGRLEPKLPSRVLTDQCQIPETINEVLASMYKERIDMTDVEYAALTQLATAPLTAVYSYQKYDNKMNSIYANGTYKKTSFTIHVVGAELQFEADVLNKWELFFLHLRPDIKDLTICLIAPNLNPSNLPLDLLGKVRLCEYCRQDKRRLQFSFQDKKTYSQFYKSDDFITPDMVCTFNPSIQRSSVYNGKDTWPSTINTILKQKIPFIITSYSIEELCRDLGRIKECSQIEFNLISEPKLNSFSSVRPDRNFITDDEMPLLFKNYCFAVVCGVF